MTISDITETLPGRFAKWQYREAILRCALFLFFMPIAFRMLIHEQYNLLAALAVFTVIFALWLFDTNAAIALTFAFLLLLGDIRRIGDWGLWVFQARPLNRGRPGHGNHLVDSNLFAASADQHHEQGGCSPFSASCAWNCLILCRAASPQAYPVAFSFLPSQCSGSGLGAAMGTSL